MARMAEAEEAEEGEEESARPLTDRETRLQALTFVTARRWEFIIPRTKGAALA